MLNFLIIYYRNTQLVKLFQQFSVFLVHILTMCPCCFQKTEAKLDQLSKQHDIHFKEYNHLAWLEMGHRIKMTKVNVYVLCVHLSDTSFAHLSSLTT